MKKVFFACAGCLLAGLLLLGPGCAMNSDIHRLNNRLTELEKRNQALNSSVEKLKEELAADREQGSTISDIRELYADQDAVIDKLRTELRELRGGFEESEHRLTGEVKSLKKDFEKTAEKIDQIAEDINSYDKRISSLEQFVGIEATAGKAPLQSESSKKTKLDDLGEDGLYSTAKQAYDNGDYETAVRGFELFLKKFPGSDRADNARFWIGEAYFAEKWYEKAILEYNKVIKNYPEGNKVPGAYLKQGMAFHQLGENSNARLVFQTLQRKYPDSNEAKIAERQLETIE
ncbi:MAG: tol-pal system protein YbgF [Desulfobacteraceae bacterium]|nr:tol-pal system protein YbgF [Desulfobacteraceae bacterium]